MASALQRQLGDVRQAVHAPQSTVFKGKVSLLFNAREAAEIDLQSIYGLASKGFQELCTLDARLEAFQNTLFSSAAVDINRDDQNQEQNRKLDASIGAVLSLMADHFQLPAATQALEFLVRRFSVQQHNQDALMHAFLVYHETTQFVRLVQIMPLAGTMWSWLQPMQKSGSPMPRHTLRQRCIKDQAVLRFIADTARASAAAEECARLQVTFYTTLACEVIAAVPRVNESQAGALLPAVRGGLGRGASAHMRASACSVVACLAIHTTLSLQLLSEVVELSVKNGKPEDLQQVLLLLVILCGSQPQLTSFPSKALKHLVKFRSLVADLVTISRLGASIGPLLAALLPALASAHPATSEHTPHRTQEQILVAAFDQVTIEPAVAQDVAKALMKAALEEDGEATERSASLSRILRTISRKHADRVDAALNEVLAAADSAGTAELEGQLRAERSARLAPLLWVGLSGAAYAPLPDGTTTLALAVDAASSQTRILALQELDRRAVESGGTGKPETDTFLTQALLRRLKDDSMKVAAVAVGLDAVTMLPPAALLDAMEALMQRAAAVMSHPPAAAGVSNSDRKHARTLARQILKALGANVWADGPAASHDRAAALVLEVLLSGLGANKSSFDEKVTATAQRVAETLGHPLLDGLSALQPVDKTAGSADEQEAGRVRTIVAALSVQLSDSSAARSAAAKLLTASGPAAQLLLALAAVHVCSTGSSKSKQVCGAALVVPLLTATAAISHHTAQDGSELVNSADGYLPSSKFFVSAKADQQEALAAVMRAALLHALQTRPATTAASLQDDGRTFQVLASLQPPASFQPHLDVLLSKIEALVPQLNFLAAAFGGVPLCASPASTLLQIRSLQLFKEVCTAAANGRPAQQAAAGSAAVAMLPHLLAALSSISADVRTAALEQMEPSSAVASIAAHAQAGDDGTKLIGEHFCTLLHAVAKLGADVRRDPEAVLSLLAETIAAAEQSDGNEPAIPSSRNKAGRKTSIEASLVGPLQLPSTAALAIAEYLTSRLPLLQAPHDAAAARATLKALCQWQTPGARLLSALQLLKHVAPHAAGADDESVQPFFDVLDVDDTKGTTPPGTVQALLDQSTADASGTAAVASLAGGKSSLSDLDLRMVAATQTGTGAQRQALCCDLLKLYTPEAVVEACVFHSRNGDDRRGQKSVMDPFVAIGWGLGKDLPGTPAERLAARNMITPELHAVLSPFDQHRVFLGLLWGSTTDTDMVAKNAAYNAINQLPLKLRYIQQMLDDLAALAPSDAPPATPATARKRTLGASHTAAPPAAVTPSAQVLDAAIAAMEMLTWKSVDAESDALVATLCRCLRALAAACKAADTASSTALAQASGSAAESDADADNSIVSDADDDTPALPRVAQLSYAMRICLSVLEKLASTDESMGEEGPSEISTWDITAVLAAARAAADVDARRLALRLLSTLALWKPAATLDHVMEVVAFAGSAAAADQGNEASFLAATEALLAVLPAWLAAGRPAKETAAAVIKAALALPHHRQLPLLTALFASLPKETALHTLLLELMRLSQSALSSYQGAASDCKSVDVEAQTATDLAAQAGQCLDLAASICSQATELGRAQAFVSVIQTAESQEQADESHQQLHLALLITAQQLARSTAPAVPRDQPAELDDTYATLLRLALKHTLGSSGGRRRGVLEAAQLVVTALQTVMDPAVHASATVSLAADRQASERLRRKALKLLAADAAAIAQMAEETEGSGHAIVASAVEAALSFAPLLSEYFVVSGTDVQPAMAATTRQAALAAFGSLARSLGPIRAGPLMRAAPAVVTALRDSHRAVRSSSLVAAGALLHGIGHHAVQLLPQLAPAILGAAASAVVSVATEPTSAAAQLPDTPKSKAGKGKHQHDGGSGDENAAALEAATALAAVMALVRVLPKFLSPYLPAILQLCLNPVVWGPACVTSGAAAASRAIRELLPTTVPPRLLLPALVGQWGAAQAHGAVAMVELLVMVAALIRSNTPATAATHSEPTFRFLLPALDVRHTQHSSLTEIELLSVETAAVAALEALTLKLNERIFKPLFLRFVEWARAVPAPPVGGDEKAAAPRHSNRPAVLFAAAAALTQRMQTVFVPYFRYLMDPLVAALEGDTHSGAPLRPVKRRKSAPPATDAAAMPTDPAEEAAAWYTRIQALLALEQCFLHQGDSGFLDEPRFQRLLLPLVAQLPTGPASSATGAHAAATTLTAVLPQRLAEEASAWDPSAGKGLTANADPFGVVVAAALVRLASAASSDARHRPLNRAVLMVTRGGDLRTRQRALAVIHGIVGALGEEYALLLPESLPFLSELLEDEDAGVASSTAALVSRLEELTGEGLDQHLKT